jgi:hypothetical protein
MRTFLFFAGSTVGSLAFQITVAIYPQQLQGYSWAVKWLWIAWGVIWVTWLILHPKFLGGLFSGNTKPESKPGEPAGVVTIQDSLKQEFNPVFAPKIEIGIPTTAPVPVPIRSLPDVPLPNLKVNSVRNMAVYMKYDHWSRYDEEGQSKRFHAIVAEIKNCEDESRPVGKVINVKAEIIILSPSGGRDEYSPLTWLETEYNNVNIDLGDSEFLLLAVNYAPFGNPVPDWRIVLNRKGFSDPTPGVLKMDSDNFIRIDANRSVILNILHPKSGRNILRSEGNIIWKNDLLDIVLKQPL